MNVTAVHTIEVADDHAESEQFVAWLIAQGHDAKIGRSTGNYIDGVWTLNDEQASETMNALWNAYCNA